LSTTCGMVLDMYICILRCTHICKVHKHAPTQCRLTL
jgi:hypothetical protein